MNSLTIIRYYTKVGESQKHEINLPILFYEMNLVNGLTRVE